MKTKEFIKKVESNPAFEYDFNIEAYITKEIIDGNIDFLTIMHSYFKHVKRYEESKWKEIEMTTLLALNGLDSEIPL